MVKLRDIAEGISKNHCLSIIFETAKTEYTNIVPTLKQQGIDNIDESETLYSQRSELNQQIEVVLYWQHQLEEMKHKTPVNSRLP